ncbi:HTH-type transcriptional regulator GlpR [Halobacterium noricense]|uniref:HTH-type transcriptional regulator GlpR n=1 Tax=Halobacterium noricense TaxID=223182 RepID=UPI001E3AA2E4|nr:HTH-type transcriptional regulator GlpR [Halobacterium noricense]UHH24281.1 DeoR/GlpR family DNA-binding transcription regulator [Halobacterium noricense]
MLPEVRKRKIVGLVTDQGGCSVDDLSEELEFSKATIRRDLNDLAEQQLIERSHGGAVPATSVGEEQTYGQKEVQNLEAKMAIAERAVEEIHENEVVFFDGGTTTMQVAQTAPRDGSFMAVTNSPPLSLKLIQRDNEVKITGGSLRERTRSLVGPSAERFMEQMNFDLLFLGTNAIDLDQGLMTPNEDEARLKELMIQKSQRVVLVADGTKLDEQSFVRFAEFEDVDTFVTDEPLSEAAREPFQSAGAELIEVRDR